MFRLSISVYGETPSQAPDCELRESIISVLSDGWDEENVPTQSLRSKPVSSQGSESFIPVELTASKSDPGIPYFICQLPFNQQLQRGQFLQLTLPCQVSLLRRQLMCLKMLLVI